MTISTLPTRATAKNTGATVSFRCSNGSAYYELCVSLSKGLCAEWGVTPGDLRVVVQHDAATNKLWLVRAGRHDRDSRAGRWNRHRKNLTSCIFAITLPNLHGEKRPAEAVSVRIESSDSLVLDLPEWAQPTRYRQPGKQEAA